MAKAVYDTNIVVSAVLHRDGLPALLLSLALGGGVRLFVSEEVLLEYEAVLKRPRFGLKGKGVEHLIGLIAEKATLVRPTRRLQVIKGDDADNRILECALKAKADFIVTGNKRHFPFEEFRGIRIVTPREFINRVIQDVAL